MELDRIGVCELEVWQFEPLAGLDRILTNTNKSHDSLGVEASGVADGLQENTVEFVDLGTVFSSSALYKVSQALEWRCKEDSGKL